MMRIAWLLAITATLGAADAQAQSHAQRRRVPVRTQGAAAAEAKPAKPAPADEIKPEEPAAPPAESVPPVAAPPAAVGSSSTAGASVAPPAEARDARPARDAAKNDAQAGAEVAVLEQELAQLMDDLVQARERVAVIGKSLFKTRVRVKLDNRAAPDQVAGKVLIRLDGAPIFQGDGSALQDADRALFDGFAAPGPHVLSLEIEQRARSDESYRYGLREHYRFDVLRERRTDLRLILNDDSDIADDFHDDQKGEYDVRTRLEVRASPLNED